MNKIYSCGILGLGSSLPEKVLTNFDLEKMVDTSDEWIVKRTGISERRVLREDEPAYKLAVDAGRKALDDAGISPEELDLIIVATETPDYYTPSMACIVQSNLNATNAAAFDLNSACSGFIYALTVSSQFIQNGYYKYILLIGCEGLSKIIDWKDRNTCVLFGDGAGAAVVGRVDEGYGIIATHIGADGSLGRCITAPSTYASPEDLEVRKGDNKRVLVMDGSEVFKFAVKVMERGTIEVLEQSNMTLDDIKLIIPHQANIRILDNAAKRLGISKDKVFSNLYKYGNISSASIPVGLEEAYKNNLFSKGDNLVLVSFGAGLTWASALIKWSK
ncbi:beta-ketoacyl-ACP synthase III [Acetivibrio saccincola]|uniref:Beta-ketoacyl-[acyl-carrier-protein] synthase III n=1 Tax=Acetivibrio saccincola TaxID=1677857 RepID=A0A2K9EIE1_9FIRM|nr:beta-ketoacyl-ACP synthase III [Acetivibrio saccincola]AUG57703.1 3-oxoacyl-[acyl-carrier-protein] synthase 3 [Acetivibrio saccincola]NLW26478.1 ketoacyl-ACP synthase III [Acetivibrio saccincola]PQQ67594.1 3-oxoacyl-ACP synthase [Acetivibrio saccincola]HOA97835.1 beta-ketoacyl-ACP synthase III [Acetivibrio saccincola]HQD28914.1 beta-ketoacyl-ACP synthase III [Acetivibrio saccincola]